MEIINDIELYKINLLNVIAHHKETCSGENCNISLFLLREMAEKAGIKFTDDETLLFL